ncbi:MAG: DJ-1/PfpI family protein [Rhodanobacter sp.]|jgi:putative intracellular protease/amidase|nr:DJ-1/PfpI family protein [Rhodanobacter sp.]
MKIGTVLFDGFELLDVYGPLEMFSLIGEHVRLLTFAQTPGLITSSPGPQSFAEAALTDANDLDVLLIPGGRGTRHEVNNEPLLEALRHASERARYVASVCTGSALLAKAGLLDGKCATTNKRAYAWVTSQGTATHWIAEARWVVDGKFFTSAGISAGMDMALALISHLCGKDTAHTIAQRAEYEWHQDPARDPFAKLNGIA